MKKYFDFTKPANFIFAAILAVLGFFSIYGINQNASPIYMGILGALALAMINGAFNGLLVGGISSLASITAAIIYKVNYQPLPVPKAGLEGDKLAKAMAKIDAYKAFVDGLMGKLLIIILAAAILMVLARFIYLQSKKEMTEVKPLSAKMITYCGVFIAISVVLNTLRIGSISFGGFPIIYGGLALGPVYGTIIGAAADLLGFLIRPSAQSFNVLFVLTSALTGAIPAMVIKLFPKEKQNKNVLYVLAAIAVGQLITSVLMVPAFMQMLYGTPFAASFVNAAIKQLYSVPLYAVLYVNTQRVVSNQIDFEKVKTN